jgi:hypothetical protein
MLSQSDIHPPVCHFSGQLFQIVCELAVNAHSSMHHSPPPSLYWKKTSNHNKLLPVYNQHVHWKLQQFHVTGWTLKRNQYIIALHLSDYHRTKLCNHTIPTHSCNEWIFTREKLKLWKTATIALSDTALSLYPQALKFRRPCLQMWWAPAHHINQVSIISGAVNHQVVCVKGDGIWVGFQSEATIVSVQTVISWPVYGQVCSLFGFM